MTPSQLDALWEATTELFRQCHLHPYSKRNRRKKLHARAKARADLKYVRDHLYDGPPNLGAFQKASAGEWRLRYFIKNAAEGAGVDEDTIRNIITLLR